MFQKFPNFQNFQIFKSLNFKKYSEIRGATSISDAFILILPLVPEMMIHDHMRTFNKKSFSFDEKYDVANYDEDDDTFTT